MTKDTLFQRFIDWLLNTRLGDKLHEMAQDREQTRIRIKELSDALWDYLAYIFLKRTPTSTDWLEVQVATERDIAHWEQEVKTLIIRALFHMAPIPKKPFDAEDVISFLTPKPPQIKYFQLQYQLTQERAEELMKFICSNITTTVASCNTK